MPEERVMRKIFIVRGERMMLDSDLAELYGVETRVLKQAVKRNLDRFPSDFMIELTWLETRELQDRGMITHVSHFGGANPFAFTEAGVAMLSSVLKSKQAIEMNITIMRSFVSLRKMASQYEEVLNRIEQFEEENNIRFKEIFGILHNLLSPPSKERKKIGFSQVEPEVEKKGSKNQKKRPTT
jgi:hypothetical protein